MQGIDLSQPVSTSYAQAVKADGTEFVGRYLGRTRSNSGKILSSDEAKRITNAGLWILSIFEWYADRTKEGASAGSEDGQWASDRAHIVGQPAGSAIFPCVDFDASRPDFDTIEQYLRAFGAKTPDYRLGVYGEYDVCMEMLNRGVVDLAWQTVAWSRGETSDKFVLYQQSIDKSYLGNNVDFNICKVDPVTAGLWGQSAPIVPKGKGEKLVQFQDRDFITAETQKQLLVSSLQKYYDMGLIHDYRWVEAAANGTLTESELGMLNSIVSIRIANGDFTKLVK